MTELLIFHPSTRRVLRGPWTGLIAATARDRMECHGWRCTVVHLRPWWRAWRLTPAFRMERRS